MTSAEFLAAVMPVVAEYERVNNVRKTLAGLKESVDEGTPRQTLMQEIVAIDMTVAAVEKYFGDEILSLARELSRGLSDGE